MLTGTMTNGIVMLTTTGGVPIVESTAPENIPAGYHAQMGFVDNGTQIMQTWTVVPDVGTVADAAATLAQMQAASLSDDDALKVPALFSRVGEQRPLLCAGRPRCISGQAVQVPGGAHVKRHGSARCIPSEMGGCLALHRSRYGRGGMAAGQELHRGR